MDKLTVKFTSTTLQDTVGFDIYKIYEDLFLPLHERHNNLLMEGIQTEKLCKIRLKAADEETMGMDAKRLWMPFLATCTVSVGDHQNSGRSQGFLSRSPFNVFMFELLLTLALQVVNSSDASKLVYKLTNIQMEYETIHNKKLSNTATRTYTSSK